MDEKELIISYSEPVLITGSNGFIGPRVVKTLLDYGFTNLRCFVRPSSDLTALKGVVSLYGTARVEIIAGDLLSQEDCDKLTEGIRVVYHLAAAMRDTSYESSYLNNVVTTGNVLNGAAKHMTLRRFVNISSIRVYSNYKLRRGALLDETCDIESDLVNRGDAYCNAKVKQDELVSEFCSRHNLPYVILRPGIVYGPGNREIHRMIGRRIKKGGIELFLHLGGSNRLPLSYVDNCADAIVLAGIKKGVDGETFNVVDDDLPTSRSFLTRYKQNVQQFRSIYIPYRILYAGCYLSEKYSKLSRNRMTPAMNRKKCSAAWKGNRYSNAKLKQSLEWKPKISFNEALKKYFGQQGEITI